MMLPTARSVAWERQEARITASGIIKCVPTNAPDGEACQTDSPKDDCNADEEEFTFPTEAAGAFGTLRSTQDGNMSNDTIDPPGRRHIGLSQYEVEMAEVFHRERRTEQWTWQLDGGETRRYNDR